MRNCCLLPVLCFACAAVLPAANPKAQKAFREGLRFEAASQWKEAEQAYSDAIQNDPEDPLSYQHRAKVRYALADYRHALEDADRVVRFEPGSAEAYQLRGDAYRKLPDLSKAVADYSRAIELKLDSAAIYN